MHRKRLVLVIDKQFCQSRQNFLDQPRLTGRHSAPTNLFSVAAAHHRHHGGQSSETSELGLRGGFQQEDQDRRKAQSVPGSHVRRGEQWLGLGEPAANSPLAGMKRRETTAQQASKAEDSDSNPFTGREHSQKYFQILQTRRDLPVHKQRYVLSRGIHRIALAPLLRT